MLRQQSGLSLLPFKHELTEMALVEVPDIMKLIGVTVMDGSYFSVMPYPSRHRPDESVNIDHTFQ